MNTYEILTEQIIKRIEEAKKSGLERAAIKYLYSILVQPTKRILLDQRYRRKTRTVADVLPTK